MRTKWIVYELTESERSDVGQANKSARGMPWHQEPMKDVISCDKLRGAANKHWSADQCSLASLFLLSNQNPLALGFWFVIWNNERSSASWFQPQSTHRQSIWFSLSWIMQAHKRSFLAKNCILPFLIKSFPLLLPSHNIASIIKQCSVFKVHLVLFSALRMLTSVSPAPLRFRLLSSSFKKLSETSHFPSASFPPLPFFMTLQSASCMVESTGIEPVTSCLQGRRSPSWANPPY